jgi:hypothetical protein
LRLYNAPDLREHCLNAVSVETPRAIRLAKEKQSAEIDGAVALSFAVLAAVQRGKPPSLSDKDSGEQFYLIKLGSRAPYSLSRCPRRRRYQQTKKPELLLDVDFRCLFKKSCALRFKLLRRVVVRVCARALAAVRAKHTVKNWVDDRGHVL